MLRELNDYTKAVGMADMPERLQNQWLGFREQAEKVLSQPLYVEADMLSLMKELEFNGELQRVILEQTKVIEASKELSVISKFLKWALFDDMEPWKNDIYDMEPDVGIMNEHKGVLILIVICAGMISSLREARTREIPESYITYALKNFSWAVNGFYDSNKAWGLGNVGWDLLSASFTLFKIDKYSFNIAYYSNPAVLYRNPRTGDAVMLAMPGYEYNNFGERVSYDEVDLPTTEGGFISQMNETDEYIEGNYIYPIGYASREIIRLNKSEWVKTVYPGCITLSFHIPRGVDYTAETVKSDFRQALEFYRKYFPEMEFAAFTCHSWLFSAQLQLIFDEDESKVVRLQRETYLQASMADDESFEVFVFGEQKIDVNTSPRDTTLRKRLLEFIERGGSIRGGEMLLPIEDIGRSRPYYKQEHLEEIRELYRRSGII